MNLEPTSEKGKEKPGWVQYLQEKYTGSSRPCRHALTGRVNAPKICTMNYECYHCPYDQMLDEMDLEQAGASPNYKLVTGYKLAEGYYYHMGHSWARFEHGGRVKIGFDDFLVRLFGAAQKMELPPLGATIKQNQVGLTFSRDENMASVLSPVTGTVLATNHKVQDHPEIINEDPYHSGWLFIMEPNFPKRDLRGLYFGDDSYRWIETENQKLTSMLGPEYEQLASTGGEAVHDLYGALLAEHAGLEWDNIVRTFLHTKVK